VGLASEVIELVWADAGKQAPKRSLVAKVRVVEFKGLSFAPQMLDSGAVELTGAPDKAVNSVALL
jgi:hypothetical protein